MPSKYRIILEMASQTARDIASNADRYTDFLITAANNYKYSFKEQLLIHAQKPDATACAEIDTWNKLGRWVNKGTKGIALLIDRDVPYKLRHVFDISDTNSRAGRNITLWQMKPEYEYAVSESLQASFGDVEEPRDRQASQNHSHRMKRRKSIFSQVAGSPELAGKNSRLAATRLLRLRQKTRLNLLLLRVTINGINGWQRLALSFK